MIIHSGIQTDPKKKEAEENKIKKGLYEVVIVVRMLLEGFNYPPFSIAAILRPIRSPVTFAQFIGRVRRRVSCEKEFETGVVADVITHRDFRQSKMYEYYKNHQIPDTEDEYMDEDMRNVTGSEDDAVELPNSDEVKAESSIFGGGHNNSH